MTLFLFVVPFTFSHSVPNAEQLLTDGARTELGFRGYLVALINGHVLFLSNDGKVL